MNPIFENEMPIVRKSLSGIFRNWLGSLHPLRSVRFSSLPKIVSAALPESCWFMIIFEREEKVMSLFSNSIFPNCATSFENFSNEKYIHYWKPYKEDINKTSEGFQNSPYKGYNKYLYE